MSAEFHISVDPVRAIVRLTISGFFAVDDVEAFAARQRAAYAQLAYRSGEHLTLCDVSDCKIQTQDVFEAFRTLLADESLMSRRIAFVTGISPAKMQIRRIIDRDDARFFDDLASAEAWLFAPAAAPVGDHAILATAGGR